MSCRVVDCQHVGYETTNQCRRGATREEQFDERGVGSGKATKNNETMALGGGRGNGQW